MFSPVLLLLYVFLPYALSFIVVLLVVLFVVLSSPKRLPRSIVGVSKCIAVAPAVPHSIAIIPIISTRNILEFVSALILLPPLIHLSALLLLVILLMLLVLTMDCQRSIRLVLLGIRI